VLLPFSGTDLLSKATAHFCAVPNIAARVGLYLVLISQNSGV